MSPAQTPATPAVPLTDELFSQLVLTGLAAAGAAEITTTALHRLLGCLVRALRFGGLHLQGGPATFSQCLTGLQSHEQIKVRRHGLPTSERFCRLADPTRAGAILAASPYATAAQGLAGYLPLHNEARLALYAQTWEFLVDRTTKGAADCELQLADYLQSLARTAADPFLAQAVRAQAAHCLGVARVILSHEGFDCDRLAALPCP